jgi:large subunit ribosomal protein L33
VAKKKGDRILVRLMSSESAHIYHTEKSRRNDTERLTLRKYDPIVRRYAEYRETR